MKINKKIAILAILGVTSMFAAGDNDISMLVEKINNTKDQKVKTELLDNLDSKLEGMKKEDLAVAQEIISKKLKEPKILAN